jgi:hypothetical protein
MQARPQQSPQTGDSLDVFMDEAGAPSPAERQQLPMSSLRCPKPGRDELGARLPHAGRAGRGSLPSALPGAAGPSCLPNAGPSFEF